MGAKGSKYIGNWKMRVTWNLKHVFMVSRNIIFESLVFFIFRFLGVNFYIISFAWFIWFRFEHARDFAGVAGSILCSTSTDIASKVQQQCNMLDTFRWRGLLVPWIGWVQILTSWKTDENGSFTKHPPLNWLWGSRYFLDILTWTKKLLVLWTVGSIIFSLSVLGNSKLINSGKEWHWHRST